MSKNEGLTNRSEAAWELFETSCVVDSDVTELFALEYPFNDVRGFQGGCSDGERYYYIAAMHYDFESQQENNFTRIAKIDLQQRCVVKWSNPIALHHANDIAYDPDTKLLAVCHCKPCGERVTLIDSETLEPVRDIDLPFSIYSIDFCPARGLYAVGLTATRNFRYLDRNFNSVDDCVIKGSSELLRYTKQGLGVDDRLLYFILWDGKHKNEDDFQNLISVYDWDGAWRGVLNFDVGRYEPENISVMNGELIAACGSAKGLPCLYRITPKSAKRE